MTLHRAGRIVRPHGLDGSLLCVPDGATAATLVDRERWYVGLDASSVMLRAVDSVRKHQTSRGEALIVSFVGVHSRDDAERLTGALVFVRDDTIEASPTDHRVDLKGFIVVEQDGSVLGTVSEIRRMPAQDLIVVVRQDGSEILIPAIKPFVSSSDAVTRRVVVDLPDGFLDI